MLLCHDFRDFRLLEQGFPALSKNCFTPATLGPLRVIFFQVSLFLNEDQGSLAGAGAAFGKAFGAAAAAFGNAFGAAFGFGWGAGP